MLGRVGKPPAKMAQKDCGPALDERELVAPESKREAQAEVSGQCWVWRFAGEMGGGVRNPDADRVQSLVEHCGPGLHAAQQGLSMCDRGRTGEDRERRELARQVVKNAAPDRPGQKPEEPSERKVRNPIDSFSVI